MNETTTNRRDFLVAGGVAATGVLMTSGGVFAAADETIKVGLIGCGGRGSGAIRDCLQADKSTKLVAVGDVFKNRIDSTLNGLSRNKNFAGRYDVKDHTYVGLDAYQKVIDAGVDLVILATPPGFRPIHLAAAVKANKHVFTEKPVAVDVPGINKCYATYEEALKKKLVIVAGTQRRHQKGYLETMKAVQDGAIGNIVAARCSWNGDGIWFRKREQGMTDVAYQLHNWYHFVWTCGDHIVEQHVHNLDVINWALGNSHPIRAVGLGGRTHRPGGPSPDVNEFGHIFDQFSIEFEYPNNVRVFSFCRHIPGTPGDVSELLIGSTGTCQVNGYSINRKKVGSDSEVSPYVQEHIDLIAAIKQGKALNELKNVTDSTMTAIMGRMATYTGLPLTWTEALKSTESTMPSNLTWDMKLPVAPVAIPGQTKLV